MTKGTVTGGMSGKDKQVPDSSAVYVHIPGSDSTTERTVRLDSNHPSS